MAASLTPAVARTRSRWLLTTCVLTVGLMSLVSPRVEGQGPAIREEDIKASFLYNFARFVEWPERSFGDSNAAFRIEIVGRDPFDGRLDQLMIGKKIDDRPIEVIHSLMGESPTPVQMAFVSASEIKRLDALLRNYRRSQVLTVSDIADFTLRGGMIGFVAAPGAVRFTINQSAVEQAQLRMSSRLLALGVPRLAAR
jgi:hypothetical protein